jgi:DNA-binding transcriptional LysR family regulator
VGELRDLRRGRVLIGSNEAGVHALLPVIQRFRTRHPGIRVDVRRMPARTIGVAVLQRTIDCGVVTFAPQERGLESITLGRDELVMLAHPAHPLAKRRHVTSRELGEQTVIAHSDPSPARDRVLRLYEQRHEPLNIEVSLPSLDGIKRAVEMKMGIALLPRRCALAELTLGQLVAVPVKQLRLPRQIRLLHRQSSPQSHATAAFVEVARALARKAEERAPSR